MLCDYNNTSCITKIMMGINLLSTLVIFGLNPELLFTYFFDIFTSNDIEENKLIIYGVLNIRPFYDLCCRYAPFYSFLCPIYFYKDLIDINTSFSQFVFSNIFDRNVIPIIFSYLDVGREKSTLRIHKIKPYYEEVQEVPHYCNDCH